jgi:UbiD family decarboxylase
MALGLPTKLTKMGIINEWRKKAKTFSPLTPREVSSGPICENTIKDKQINLHKLPAIKWHELDGGRYIGTGDAVVLMDPDTRIVNIGAYRVMVHDEKTTGMCISPGRHGDLIVQKYHARGNACPVAIVCGEEPAIFIESAYTVAQDVPGFSFAGWLRGEPVEYVVSDVTGLPIPVNSELVIEGRFRLKIEGWRGCRRVERVL